MLGVLVVVLGRDRIAGGLRVAGELNVFLGDVGGISADFHIRAVRIRTRAPSDCDFCGDAWRL